MGREEGGGDEGKGRWGEKKEGVMRSEGDGEISPASPLEGGRGV